MNTNQYTFILKIFLKKFNLNDNIINEITSCFKLQHYNKNDFFSTAGKIEDKIGFIITGIFYIYIIKEDGKIFTKDFVRNEQFVLPSLNPEEECKVYIQALKDSIVLQTKYSDIQKLYKKYPDFEEISKNSMNKRIDAIYKRLESYATLEAKARYNQFKEYFGDLENDIPQYLIASYLGITPTQLCRIKQKIK